MTRFDLFVGIDWSGAKGEHHKGIQWAEATLDDPTPRLVAPPHDKGWSRHAVINRLNTLRDDGVHILAGIDFAFCHPFGDKVHYFPGLADAPQSPQELWPCIDDANQDQDHHYGGGIWGHSELRRFYNAPKNKDGRGGRGDLFESRRRLTENIAARMNKRSPSPTFNCVGPAGVGTGSLAGMRMLHEVKKYAAVWPFLQSPLLSSNGSLTLVEIFPALYFTMAGVKDKDKKSDPLAALNQGLSFFNASPRDDVAKGLPDHDDIDALISAAALRDLHDPETIFAIPQEHRRHAEQEGWIFGAGHVTK